MEQIRLDLAGCTEARLGVAGVSPADIESSQIAIAETIERVNAAAGQGMAAWRRLPHDPVRSTHLEAVANLVNKHSDVKTIVVLGIGGSSLGTIALHAALRPLTWNLIPDEERGGPRLFVLDNIDPDFVGPVFEEVRRLDPGLEHTLFNVISKSGETAETAAQLMIVHSMLKSAGNETGRIVATTDARRGTLRTLCNERAWDTLPIPDGVGGRFSVLSPVGLFPAALSGIDIGGLLDGAAAMDSVCRATNEAENPAARLAWMLLEQTRRGRHNHVLMPYSNRLAMLADWYRQLWAESLGKLKQSHGEPEHMGPTPIRALGATDQHSQIQLYRDGPDDKVVGFVTLDEHENTVKIPPRFGVESLKYLERSDLGQLMHAEQRATEYALATSQRPHYTIALPKLDAPSIGQFIWLWQVATAMAGDLLGIDPYDQPAVDTGKQATFGLMGRQGFDQWVSRVDELLG